MVDVSEFILVEKPKKAATTVWVTDEAKSDIAAEGDLFLAKLRRYAENGFQLYTGKKKPIRPEGDGVYRIGDGSRFRAMGFFDGKDFVIVGCCSKKGKALGGKCKGLVAKCAKVRKGNQWQKV